MTKLNKPIRRETDVLTPIRSGGGKPIVVILHPHGVIELREKGRRSGYQLGLAEIYRLAAVHYADQARAEKRAKHRKVRP